MKRYYISYKTKKEPYLTYFVAPYGELTEILNWLIKEDDVLEFVSINEMEESK